jgi:hypothetical protein
MLQQALASALVSLESATAHYYQSLGGAFNVSYSERGLIAESTHKVLHCAIYGGNEARKAPVTETADGNMRSEHNTEADYIIDQFPAGKRIEKRVEHKSFTFALQHAGDQFGGYFGGNHHRCGAIDPDKCDIVEGAIYLPWTVDGALVLVIPKWDGVGSMISMTTTSRATDFHDAINTVLAGNRVASKTLVPMTAIKLLEPTIAITRAHELTVHAKDHVKELDVARGKHNNDGGSTLMDGISSQPYNSDAHDVLLHDEPLLTSKKGRNRKGKGTQYSVRTIDADCARGKLIVSTGLADTQVTSYLTSLQDKIRAGAKVVADTLTPARAEYFVEILASAKNYDTRTTSGGCRVGGVSADRNALYDRSGSLDKATELHPQVAMQLFVAELMLMDTARLKRGCQSMGAAQSKIGVPIEHNEATTRTVRAYFSTTDSTLKLTPAKRREASSKPTQQVAVSWLVTYVKDILDMRATFEQGESACTANELVTKVMTNQEYVWTGVAI